ncbi:uncharacterized protein BDW70DRAFT_94806 [Aspergillus foveolatus]|uniref:uncharacterized protein n=1 Tax=Aspergillus foveolatus TaxID=210207 RepID=UPI003CCDCA67
MSDVTVLVPVVVVVVVVGDSESSATKTPFRDFLLTVYCLSPSDSSTFSLFRRPPPAFVLSFSFLFLLRYYNIFCFLVFLVPALPQEYIRNQGSPCFGYRGSWS